MESKQQVYVYDSQEVVERKPAGSSELAVEWGGHLSGRGGQGLPLRDSDI